jgi:hypothetical protein
MLLIPGTLLSLVEGVDTGRQHCAQDSPLVTGGMFVYQLASSANLYVVKGIHAS